MRITNLLKVESIDCHRQGRCLFSDLSFELGSAQILQIEGQNGAGKTSLLRILAGFVSAQSGQVLWQGTNIKTDSIKFAIDSLYIGHKTGVNLQLTALENTAFWLETHGLEAPQDAYEILAKIGLVGFEDVPVRMLSAGQQRRVALARLWLNNAKLWLLDEPFTALDKRGTLILQQQFQAHLSAGGSIILTSHQDLTEHFTDLSRLILEYNA